MPRFSPTVAAYIGIAFIAAMMGSRIRPVGASGRFSGVIEMPRAADDEDFCKSAYCRELWQSNLLEVIMLTLKYRQPAANGVLDFYKLSLQWQPSTCKTTRCISQPTLGEFTIHGLWPQNFPDTGVPPYATDPSCLISSTVPPQSPVDPSVVIGYLDAVIQSQLTTEWPNLKKYNDPIFNQGFWVHEWGYHGMCSAWPDQPADYFGEALTLKSNLEGGTSLRTILAGLGITPGGGPYAAQDIQDQLKQQYNNIIPEISCRTVGTDILLWEIRFCYTKNTASEPDLLMNCPTEFSNACSNLGGQTQIIFPPP